MTLAANMWAATTALADSILAALTLAARPAIRRADNACHLALNEDTETITWTQEPSA